VVNDSILIEIKASKLTTKLDERQLYYYLKNSVYELGYLINFSSPKRVFIKRIIYTNDKKKFLKMREI